MEKTWHDEHTAKMGYSDRFAETMTTWIASDASLIGHTVLFVGAFASVAIGLLTLMAMLLWLTTAVSIEAIYLCIFLQRSSNMHGDRDRIQAEHDYQTNVESKELLVQLHEKIDAMKNPH